MKTKTINNLDYFERDDRYIELVTSRSCCDPDSILIEKADWYQLIEWLIGNDSVVKKMVWDKRPRRLSVREKAARQGRQIGNRTDNRLEIDSHKRFEEDLE